MGDMYLWCYICKNCWCDKVVFCQWIICDCIIVSNGVCIFIFGRVNEIYDLVELCMVDNCVYCGFRICWNVWFIFFNRFGQIGNDFVVDIFVQECVIY